jgi:hypothetical protein
MHLKEPNAEELRIKLEDAGRALGATANQAGDAMRAFGLACAHLPDIEIEVLHDHRRHD